MDNADKTKVTEKGRDMVAYIMAAGIMLFAGVLFFQVLAGAAKTSHRGDPQAISVAVSALDENGYLSAGDIDDWHIARCKCGEHIYLTSQTDEDAVEVSMLVQHHTIKASEYAPYLIRVNGEELFHVDEDWARMWFFCE